MARPGEVLVTLAIGRTEGVSVRTLRKFLAKGGGIDKEAVGAIAVDQHATICALPRTAAERLLRAGVLRVQERQVRVDAAPAAAGG